MGRSEGYKIKIIFYTWNNKNGLLCGLVWVLEVFKDISLEIILYIMIYVSVFFFNLEGYY